MRFLLSQSSFYLSSPLNRVAVDNNKHFSPALPHESSENLPNHIRFKLIFEHHKLQLFNQLYPSFTGLNIKRQFQPIRAMLHNTLRHLGLMPTKKASILLVEQNAMAALMLLTMIMSWKTEKECLMDLLKTSGTMKISRILS
jgi:hypothetical protein